ncbi:MAG TPA: DUF2892 domain-containing protein [Polyangiaceae bacterium]|nr:DUF2892 domain-containing protein [Polyangiaceae bacterium]
MKANVSPIDAAIRAGLGFILLASPLIGLATYPFNWLGLVLIATALFSYCPLYAVLRGLAPTSAPRIDQRSRSHG